MLVYLLVVPMQGQPGRSFIDLVKDLALLALGLAVYGALFAFVGAKFKRPLLVGLVFIFGWEQAALAFPGYLKKFTIAYYLQGLVPHAMPSDSVLSLIQGIFRESPAPAASLFWPGDHSGSFLSLGRLGRRAPGIRPGAVSRWSGTAGIGHCPSEGTFYPSDLYNSY